ncbi:ATP-binding protein [Planctomycetota bacterium]
MFDKIKIKENLFLAVTAIAIGCFVIVTAVLSKISTPGAVSKQRLLGYTAIVFCIAGAGAVAWAMRYWLNLNGEFSLLSKHLKKDKPFRNKLTGNRIVGKLSDAINKRFESSREHTADLERQVEELQIQIQLSQREKRNTDAIIYSIRDAVIVIDESDRLLMANESAGKLFGFDFKDSQHKPLSELTTNPDESTSEFIDFLRQSRQGKVRASRREIEFPRDENTRTYDCIISCVYDYHEQICGAVAVLHDVTHEKEISQMKNDFVSHVSHELKTPLASITAYSEMLIDGEADDEKTRKEFYSVIQNQANRLNRLIEDILNISRIESGLIKVEKQTISLPILIKEQLQMIKSYAEEKDIEIIKPQCDEIVFGQVYADKDMISQVIVNLLSNAVKYTPAGGSVTVKVDVDETAGITRITVSDTGVGIPADELDHVFDKFYRVSANKKQAKGTGLGLNLVKQIVEKVHEGRVFVQSKVGNGSTFGVELPLATKITVEA